ncbi:integrase [Bacillus cereus]|uniref:Integrase n=1 Tax=Bacillus cereus TaxID=1396 RepID=A0AAW7NBP2_BACCE|nr:integrase [Bacillus cereus]MDN4871799.1 integrase [Bacillus cereus]
MKKEALVSRETVIELTKKLRVEAIEYVFFDPSMLQKYEGILKKLVKEKQAKAKFQEDIWFLKDRFANITFNFKLNLKEQHKFNVPLKCYVLQKKEGGINTTSIQTSLNYIKESIELTQGFSNNFDGLEEYIASQGYRKRQKLSIAVIEFLKFFSVESSEEIVDICSEYTYSERTVRSLPKFYDILVFDEILRLFFSSCSFEEKLKYYPLLLWWNITKVIPLRPIEFYNLSNNCNFKKSDGSYWITLPRRKQQPSNNEEIEVTDTIQINKEMYCLISKYKEDTFDFSGNEYLLSFNLYKNFFDNGLPSALKFIDRSKFNRILTSFYKNIIEKQYNISDLEQIKPGDTRHLAFCNMMLQGFNMLSIARIGGHKTLRQQLHYHAHLDHLAESAVHILAKKHKNRSIRSSALSLNRDVELRSKIYNKTDFKKIYEVEFGYCTDEPSQCKVGDCRYCEFYYFSPLSHEYEKGLKWLRDCSETLKIRIQEQINFMTLIGKNMEYDLKALQYPINKQEQLSTNANELKRLIEQKAMVDSILLEGEE